MSIELIKSPEYKIRKIREIRNYSQDYLAQNLGLSVRAYSKIETGETQLTIKRLNQISEVLDVHPLTILEFNEKSLFGKPTIKGDQLHEVSEFREQPIEYFKKKMEEIEYELNILKDSIKQKIRRV